MKSLAVIALLAWPVAILAQEGDKQRPLFEGRKLSQRDLDALSRKLITADQIDLKMLREWMKELEKNPEKLQAMKDQLPPEAIPDWAREMAKDMMLNPSKPDQLPKDLQSPIESPNRVPESSAAPRTPTDTSPPHRAENPVRDRNRMDPRWSNNPSVQNLVRLWERNFGSLDKTPALKRAFQDLLNASANNSSGLGIPGEERFGDLWNPETPAGREIAEWLERAANQSTWNWSDLGLGELNFGLPQTGTATTIGNLSAPTFGGGNSDIPIMPVVLAILAVIVAVLTWRQYSLRARSAPRGSNDAPLPPFNPESIHDRVSLVAAFEALSLNALGRESRAWNHRTIGERLGGMDATTAVEAAGFYERARYAPANDDFSDADVRQARRCLAFLGEAAKL